MRPLQDGSRSGQPDGARARAQATDAVVQHLNTELEGANRQLQQLDGALKRIDALETVRYLGMGSFGVVYLCRTPGGKQVVQKEITMRGSSPKEALDLIAEVTNHARLVHPHIEQPLLELGDPLANTMRGGQYLQHW